MERKEISHIVTKTKLLNTSIDQVGVSVPPHTHTQSPLILKIEPKFQTATNMEERGVYYVKNAILFCSIAQASLKLVILLSLHS